jgi:uncharacterized membrane protein
MTDKQNSRSNDDRNSNSRALIGAGLAVAAGAATFLLTRRNADTRNGGANISDAPDHVFRNPADPQLVGKTVTIGRPAKELYEHWRDFTRFPDFMDNVEQVVTNGDGTSSWTIKAPLGSSVDVITQITEDQPGRLIAWASTPESQIDTDGRVEFTDAGPGRGTAVRLTMRYKPPGGVIGKTFAKIFQREPDLQARRDLRRFKQLMETGEVTTNASPSGRKSESSTEARI